MSGMESCRCDRSVANYVSIGPRRGWFRITPDVLAQLVLDDVFRDYCLVERKTHRYRLMFDIDLKPHRAYSALIQGKELEITNRVVESVVTVLGRVRDDVGDDLRYVLADNTVPDNHGVHLHFPGITVDEALHRRILSAVIDLCRASDLGLGDHWDDIVDGSVARGNALRVLYFQKDGGHYRPNPARSTYPVPETPGEQIRLCLCRIEGS